MEKKPKTIDRVEDLIRGDLLSVIERTKNNVQYCDLVDEYKDYTFWDLLNVCKIERFGELGWLEDDEVEALKQLYQMRVDLAREIELLGLCRFRRELEEPEDIELFDEEDLEQRKDCVDRELSTYGIKAEPSSTNLRDSLDLLILQGGPYYSICGKRSKELVKELNQAGEK